MHMRYGTATMLMTGLCGLILSFLVKAPGLQHWNLCIASNLCYGHYDTNERLRPCQRINQAAQANGSQAYEEYEAAIRLYLECIEHQSEEPDKELVYVSAFSIAEILRYQYLSTGDPLTTPLAALLEAIWLPSATTIINSDDMFHLYRHAASIAKPYGKEALFLLAKFHNFQDLRDASFPLLEEALESPPSPIIASRDELHASRLDLFINTEMCIHGYYANDRELKRRGYAACCAEKELLQSEDPQDDGLIKLNNANMGYYETLFKTWTDVDPLKQQEEAPLKVIDGFTFYNELDILELRLKELYDVVDEFVLVEAKWTFAGNPKQLYYGENKDRFAAYNDKIKHIILEMDELPSDQYMHREIYQRNMIMHKGLVDEPNDTLIIISDVDEIPDPDFVHQARHHQIRFTDKRQAISLSMDHYLYNTTYKMPYRWRGSYITTVEHLKTRSPQEIRVIPEYIWPWTIGWHMSYFMPPEMIINKFQQFSHREYDHPEYANKSRIERAIKQGEHVTTGKQLIVVPMKPHRYLPRTILNSFFAAS